MKKFQQFAPKLSSIVIVTSEHYGTHLNLEVAIKISTFPSPSMKYLMDILWFPSTIREYLYDFYIELFSFLLSLQLSIHHIHHIW